MSTTKSPSHRYPFWVGGVSCSIATIITHPQDLIKVRLQTQNQYTLKPLSLAQLMQKFRGLPISAFYDGLGAAILRQLTYSTIRFATYDRIRYWFLDEKQRLPFYGMMSSSIIAGCLGGVVGNPFDIINVRMQNDASLPKVKQRNYSNFLVGFQRIIQNEGPLVLFRGLKTTVVRSILMTCSQLGSYDLLKPIVSKTCKIQESWHLHLITSLLSGLVATTICSPIDVLKTRMMSSMPNQLPPTSIVLALIQMVKNEGFKSLFKGWIPSYFRLGPHTLITFMLIEQFRTYYDRKQLNKKEFS